MATAGASGEDRRATPDDAFDEGAYDASIDALWLSFRTQLADLLAELSASSPIKVYCLWSEMFAPQPRLVFTLTRAQRLRVTATFADLFPYPPEQGQRVDLLVQRGWRPLRNETCILEFGRREVDAAALQAEQVFRWVWDVLDPSFLVSEEHDVGRRFTDPPPMSREPKMR
ncbi:MAG: hypothetical protein QM658_10125 [Gordonia sp. (in: high G+C Gram-positive bacteria)]